MQRVLLSQRKMYQQGVVFGYSPAMSMGKRIKDLREQAGMTLEDLGKCFHVGDKHLSKQAINAWEKERNQPNSEQLAVLCKTFGVSADLLLGLEPRAQADLSSVTELLGIFAQLTDARRARVLNMAKAQLADERNTIGINKG